MGTPDFSVPILQSLIESPYEVCLVVTQPDRPKGRKGTLTAPPVKEVAMAHDIPVFQPERLRENYALILDYEPDLIVTAAYGQLLPKPLLEYPKYGCINVHASLLPELRGGAPIHYAILQGKSETGITIMNMVEALDAGAILTQAKVRIDDRDTVGTLHDKLSQVGSDLLMKTLPKLFAGEITPKEQDHDQATYAPNISREQEKIDWSKSQIDIYNQIRGLNPWPVAFTTHQGKVIKCWWGEPDSGIYEGAQPGEVVNIIPEDSIVVACGDHRGIRLKEIQPAGRRKMSVADYLRGGSKDQIQIGDVLGESHE